MANQNDKNAQVHFDDYVLEWNDHGIIIRVTDYHAGPLDLSWKMIFDLANRAGVKTPQ